MIDIILVSFTSLICLAILVFFFYSYGPKMQCNSSSIYEYVIIFFSYVPFLNGVSLISYEISKYVIVSPDSTYNKSSALLIVQYCLYGTTLVLSFFVNPLLIEFEKQPPSNPFGARLKKAFCKTMLLYIVIGVLALIALIIFIALKIPINFGLIIGIIPSIMNLYGLVAFAISAGIGFVKAPVALWLNAKPVNALREYLCDLYDVNELNQKANKAKKDKDDKNDKKDNKEKKKFWPFRFKKKSTLEKIENFEDSDAIEPSETLQPSENVEGTNMESEFEFLIGRAQIQFEKVVRLQINRDKKLISLQYLHYFASILVALLALTFIIFEFSYSLTGSTKHSILRMILVKIKIDELNQIFLFVFIGLLALLSAYVFMCIKTEAVLPKPVIFIITRVFRVVPYKFVECGRTPIRTFNKWSTYLQRLIPAIAFHCQKLAGIEHSSLQTIMGKFDQFEVFWSVIRISTSALILIVIVIYVILNWDNMRDERKIQQALEIYKTRVELSEMEHNLEFYVITDEINSNIKAARLKTSDSSELTTNLRYSNSLFHVKDTNENVQVITL